VFEGGIRVAAFVSGGFVPAHVCVQGDGCGVRIRIRATAMRVKMGVGVGVAVRTRAMCCVRGGGLCIQAHVSMGIRMGERMGVEVRIYAHNSRLEP